MSEEQAHIIYMDPSIIENAITEEEDMFKLQPWTKEEDVKRGRQFTIPTRCKTSCPHDHKRLAVDCLSCHIPSDKDHDGVVFGAVPSRMSPCGQGTKTRLMLG